MGMAIRSERMGSIGKSRLNSLILLFFAIWPILYGSFFVLSWLTGLLNQASTNIAFLSTLIICHILTAGLSFGGILLYLVHVYKNDHLIGNQKMVWSIAILFLSVFSIPLYWWMHIWKRPGNKSADFSV